MTPIEKIRARFAELASRSPTVWNDRSNVHLEAMTWLIEALSLVEAVFPASDATARTMRDAVAYVGQTPAIGETGRTHIQRLSTARAAFQAAKQIVDSDGIRGFADIVRATTTVDLLHQADVLLKEGAEMAGAVVAGGALETHLAALVERHSIPLAGKPAIGTYNNAIATYRKDHPEAGLYPPATGERVEGWAKIRNKAAHYPLEFRDDYGSDHVREMIDGVGWLLSAYP